MSGAPSLPAPAKLNLYLHVTGRRPDGYHLIDSLIAFASLADRLTVLDPDAAADGLSVSGPFGAGLGSSDENLVVRAAHALSDWTGTPRPARFALEKRIPVAAGLGGGSADAAAALVMLAGAWDLVEAPLAEIGLSLGADVPVCLASQPTRVRGIGEILEPVPALPAAGLVLVNPGIALATADVFTAFDAMGNDGNGPSQDRVRADTPVPAGAGDAVGLAAALAPTGNDLTPAALSLAPAIAEVLDAVAVSPGCRLARMAGSGPTCFGLYDDLAAARGACAAITRHAGNWWCWAGELASGRGAEIS